MILSFIFCGDTMGYLWHDFSFLYDISKFALSTTGVWLLYVITGLLHHDLILIFLLWFTMLLRCRTQAHSGSGTFPLIWSGITAGFDIFSKVWRRNLKYLPQDYCGSLSQRCSQTCTADYIPLIPGWAAGLSRSLTFVVIKSKVSTSFPSVRKNAKARRKAAHTHTSTRTHSLSLTHTDVFTWPQSAPDPQPHPAFAFYLGLF